MSIKSDAIAILKFIIENKPTNNSTINKYFEFEKNRTIDALKYLEQKNYIIVKAKGLGSYWNLIEPAAEGIDFQEKLQTKEKIKKKSEPEKTEVVQNEVLEKVSRIEKSVNSLQSRSYREMTYKAALYPLIIATFIAIGFTSSIEFLKSILPDKYKPILSGVFYFLILISMFICARLFTKMRKNLDVDNYIALIEIKSKNKFNILRDLRSIFEKNEHQFSLFQPRFEGVFLEFFHVFPAI